MNAAVFVDFENLHAAVAARAAAGGPGTRDATLAVLNGTLRRLRERGDALVIGRSYAAFDTFPGLEVAHDLALLGLDPQYVLVGHSGRNSSDVQLTLEVARVLYRRDDIQRIVIVSGDRDFLPVAREVLELGRELWIVALAEATSGDLRQRIGEQRFVDAAEFLASVVADEALVEPVAVPSEERLPDAPDPEGDSRKQDDARPAKVLGHIPVTWEAPSAPQAQEALLRQAIELMMRALQRHGSDEIWLSPFLKGPMSQQFAHIVHPERRGLINELRRRGAIRVEERENLRADHPYSVIVLVDDHPLVVEVAGRMRAQAAGASGHDP